MMDCENCFGKGRVYREGKYGEPIEAECSFCEGTGENLECKEEVHAAVAAERRRVWDAFAEHLAAVESNIGAADTDEAISNYFSQRIAFVVLRDYLFPDGEPGQTNQTAGDRREQ